MADIVLRGVDDGLVRRIRVRAIEEGQTIKQWIVPKLWEALNGNDERGSKGGVGSDHGEAFAIVREHASSTSVKSAEEDQARTLAGNGVTYTSDPEPGPTTCPYCDGPLTPHKGKLGCSECNKWPVTPKRQ
jgi:plasmid stability protein